MKKLLVAACLSFSLSGCADVIREEAVVDGLTTSDWVAHAQSEDLESRRLAVQKLGELGPDEADRTVPALIAASRDPDKFVRLYAVRSVKALGPKARKATNAMARLVNDREIAIAREAMQVWKDLEMAKPSALNGH